MRHIAGILLIALFASPPLASHEKLLSESKPAPPEYQVQATRSGMPSVTFVALQRDITGVDRGSPTSRYMTFYRDGQVIEDEPDEDNPAVLPVGKCQYINCGNYKVTKSSIIVTWEKGPEAGHTETLTRMTSDDEEVLLRTGAAGNELPYRISPKHYARIPR